jgi:hypothetical protein
MNAIDKTFSPPYNLPFATFLTTIEKVAADLPTKLDRSYLGSTSGGLKSYLISAFKGFGLIHDDTTVSDDLMAMAKEPERRQEMMGAILTRFYPDAVALGTNNSTPGQLDQAFATMFPNVNGESRTKATRFFLSAMDFAKLPKSPLWKLPKAGVSGPRKKSARVKVVTGGQGGQNPTPQLDPIPGQSLRIFVLPSGRKLTISLDGDVLALGRTERKFIMDIIDKVEEHVEENAPSEIATQPEDGP